MNDAQLINFTMRVREWAKFIKVRTYGIAALHRIWVYYIKLTMEYHSATPLLREILVSIFQGHVIFRKAAVLVVEFHTIQR